MVAEIAFRRSIPQRLEAAVIPQQLRHEWTSCPSRSCPSVGVVLDGARNRAVTSLK